MSIPPRSQNSNTAEGTPKSDPELSDSTLKSKITNHDSLLWIRLLGQRWVQSAIRISKGRWQKLVRNLSPRQSRALGNTGRWVPLAKVHTVPPLLARHSSPKVFLHLTLFQCSTEGGWGRTLPSSSLPSSLPLLLPGPGTPVGR